MCVCVYALSTESLFTLNTLVCLCVYAVCMRCVCGVYVCVYVYVCTYIVPMYIVPRTRYIVHVYLCTVYIVHTSVRLPGIAGVKRLVV